MSGHGLEGRGSVGPGKQVVDLALSVAFDDAGDDVGEVALRLDGVELCGFDERGDHGPVLGPTVGASEEGVLAVESDRPDRPFDDVRIDLDAAVVEEATEAGPSAQRVADRFGELALLADEGELVAQPRLEGRDDGEAPRLAAGAPLITSRRRTGPAGSSLWSSLDTKRSSRSIAIVRPQTPPKKVRSGHRLRSKAVIRR